MFIADFLSRHLDNDTGSPNGIIPMKVMIQDLVKGDKKIGRIMSMNDIENHDCDQCMVVMRRMIREAEAAMPSVYPLKKNS